MTLFSEDGNPKPIPPTLFEDMLALPVQMAVGRLVLAQSVAATTFSIGESGAGSVVGSLAAYGAMYLDPAKFPALYRKTCKLRVSVRAITNNTAPAVDISARLRSISTWTSSTNPGPSTFGTALGTATISAPVAGTANVAEGTAFAFPAIGWYNLEVVTSATSAASSSTHIIARLERLYT